MRLDPDTMRRLKHLAVDRDCTLQALAAEAIDLLFERYEAEARSRPAGRKNRIERGTPAAMSELHELWRQCPADRLPPHPCGPFVAAWQKHAPVEVEAETRADRRIMPALRVVGPSIERERGARLADFGGLLNGRPKSAELTLWPEPARHRVPLLEIVERTGLPFRSRGKGAPIEARLLVRGGLLMMRAEDRHLQTVRVAVSVRELLHALWPTGADGRRHDRQNWPKLLDALFRARDWTVTDAGGGRWFPMALRRLPPNTDGGSVPAEDDLIVLDLAPPPGAKAGPTVALPWLDRQGMVSGPAWFAYIAARSLLWRPRRDPQARARTCPVGLERRRCGLSGADPGRLAALGVRSYQRQPNTARADRAVGAPARRAAAARSNRPADRGARLPAATRRGGRRTRRMRPA